MRGYCQPSTFFFNVCDFMLMSFVNVSSKSQSYKLIQDDAKKSKRQRNKMHFSKEEFNLDESRGAVCSLNVEPKGPSGEFPFL